MAVRPINLRMENFGPYLERTEIDFTKLGDIFLVSGQTGAGKTTIFDAMTFALYGRLTGARQGLEKSMLSHFADPTALPLVVFDFSLGADEYRIERIGPHQRKIRGGGLRPDEGSVKFYRREKQPGEFELALDDWRLISEQKKEADAAIEQVIRLSLDEFSKIVLLPQGEFQRFLEMDSSGRVDILEKLFPVELYAGVTDCAQDKNRGLKAEIESLDVEIKTLDGQSRTFLNTSGSETIEAALVRLAIEYTNADKQHDIAVKKMSAAQSAWDRATADAARFRRAAELETQLRTLDAELAAAGRRRSRIEAAQKVAGFVDLHAKAEEALARSSDAENELESLKKDLDVCVSRTPEIEGLALKIGENEQLVSETEKKIGELGKAMESWKKYSAALLEYEKAKSAGTDAQHNAEAQEAFLARLQEECDGLVPDPAKEAAAELALEKAVEETARAQNIRDCAARAGEKRLQIEAARVSERESDAALSAIDAKIKQAESDWLRRAAVLLSSQLVPGVPCPVCGSLEHAGGVHASAAQPAPASKAAASASMSADPCAALRADRDRLLAGRSSSAGSRVSAETELKKIEAQLEGLNADICDGIQAEELVKKAKCAEAAARTHKADLADRRRQYEAKQKERDLQRLKADEAQKTQNEALLHVHTLEERCAGLLAACGGKAEDPSREASREEQRRESLKREVNIWRKETSDWQIEKAQLEGSIQEKTGKLPALKSKAEDALKLAAAALQKAGYGPNSDNEALAVSMDSAALAKLIDEDREFSERYRALKASAAEARQAAGSGEAPDPEKYRLEFEKVQEEVKQKAALREEARDRRDGLGRIADGLRLALQKQSELGSRSRLINELSVLLSGGMQGRHLSFKSYVLEQYFSVIARSASLRLSEMSEGRYGLRAVEGAQSGKSQIGLELMVSDAYTGKERKAGTLSGGERFLCSLSLALGLADTICNRSSSRVLDSVFIDEGFGSLDEETLDRAIAVLDRVRGTRMIGIISHVQELKDRIPSRIEVEKGRCGSSVRII